jgi:hypothetical protein
MEKKIWGLGVAHWAGGILNLIVLAYLIGVNHQILRSHSVMLQVHTEQIKKLETDFSSLNENGSIALRHSIQVMDSLALRLNKTELAISKIEVLANDMDWLKKFLLSTVEERKKLIP